MTKKYHYVCTAGIGFGSCYPRRDTVRQIEFQSGATSPAALKAAASKAAGDYYLKHYGITAKQCGLITSDIRATVLEGI